MPVDLRSLLLRSDQEFGVIDIVLRQAHRRPEKRSIVAIYGFARRFLVATASTICDTGRPRMTSEPVTAARYWEVRVLRRWVDNVSEQEPSLAVINGLVTNCNQSKMGRPNPMWGPSPVWGRRRKSCTYLANQLI